METSVIYKKLFSTAITHDGYLDLGYKDFASLDSSIQNAQLNNYDLRGALSFIPSQSTEKLMKQHQLRLFPTKTGFDIIAATLPDENDADQHILFIPTEDDFSLKFYMKLNDPKFWSSANLSTQTKLSQQYYFSTENAHLSDGELHLTKALVPFVPAQEYLAGDMIIDDSNTPTKQWEAVQNLSAPVTQTTEDWLELTNDPFTRQEDTLNTGVSRADLLTIQNHYFSIQIPENITFAKVIVTAAEESEPVFRTSFFHDTGEPLDIVKFHLPKHTQSGFYDVEILSSDDSPILSKISTYVLPEKQTEDFFALLEITNKTVSHSFLNTENQLTSPKYHIRFRKRHTYWKYIMQGDVESIDQSSTDQFNTSETHKELHLISKDPHPYSRQILFGDEIDFLGSNTENSKDPISLPNPLFDNIKLENGKQICEAHVRI